MGVTLTPGKGTIALSVAWLLCTLVALPSVALRLTEEVIVVSAKADAYELPLPSWVARTVQLPDFTKCTVPLRSTEHTSDVEGTLHATDRPELAVAASWKSGSPKR